jgi:hypothetical protein
VIAFIYFAVCLQKVKKDEKYPLEIEVRFMARD